MKLYTMKEFVFLPADSELGPRCSLVYRRDTNLAEQIFTSTIITPECPKDVSASDLELIEPEYPTVPTWDANQSIQSINLGSVIGSLSNGIASGVGSRIAADVMALVFPSGVPSYFQEVYREFRQIVRQELIQNNINIINDQLNGIINRIRTTYLPRRRKNPDAREVLFNSLQPLQKQLAVNMLSILQNEKTREAAFPVFLLAANTNIGLLQEMALVDPLEHDPNKSSFAVTVQLEAKNYLIYAQPLWEIIQNRRVALITGARQGNSRHCRGRHGVCIATCSGFDRLVSRQPLAALSSRNTQSCPCHDAPGCIHSRDVKLRNHRRTVLSNLAKSIGSPVGIFEGWRRLQNNPIPQGDHIDGSRTCFNRGATLLQTDRARLVFQGDGNLVLYRGGSPLWASGKKEGATRVCFQMDGNLVIYNTGTALWSTQTNGLGGITLSLQSDCNLVISGDNGVVWQTNTGGSCN